MAAMIEYRFKINRQIMINSFEHKTAAFPTQCGMNPFHLEMGAKCFLEAKTGIIPGEQRGL